MRSPNRLMITEGPARANKKGGLCCATAKLAHAGMGALSSASREVQLHPGPWPGWAALPLTHVLVVDDIPGVVASSLKLARKRCVPHSRAAQRVAQQRDLGASDSHCMLVPRGSCCRASSGGLAVLRCKSRLRQRVAPVWQCSCNVQGAQLRLSTTQAVTSHQDLERAIGWLCAGVLIQQGRCRPRLAQLMVIAAAADDGGGQGLHLLVWFASQDLLNTQQHLHAQGRAASGRVGCCTQTFMQRVTHARAWLASHLLLQALRLPAAQEAGVHHGARAQQQ